MSLDAPGSALEGYRLKRVADEEPGFFTVYECTVGPDDEPVSVRAFPVPGDRRVRRAFRRSARERAKRGHPGLLPARDVLESDGRLYLVTETVAAPTLAARLAAGPLEPRAAAPRRGGLQRRGTGAGRGATPRRGRHGCRCAARRTVDTGNRPRPDAGSCGNGCGAGGAPGCAGICGAGS